MQTNDKDSVLLRHLQNRDSEDDSTPTFKMSVINTHKTAKDRQIREAVGLHISNTLDSNLRNLILDLDLARITK